MADSDCHNLWAAARDLCLAPDQSVIFITQAPQRWDEILDTRLPILISDQTGPWSELAAGLWEAGCPTTRPLRLVQADGKVRPLSWQAQSLEPAPEQDGWTLALGWTHPDEGWRARLPLWGQRFIVTRAAEQGAGLVKKLQDLGAATWAVPTIAFADPDDFRPWIQAVATMRTFDWIVFTSPNGVDFFVQRLCQSGLDLRDLGSAKLACIGPSTAKTLAGHGLKADLVPEEFVAEGLLAALEREIGDLKNTRILLPRAQVARTVLPDALSEAGADVLVAPIYKTVAPDLSNLPQEEANLLFTSSSTVTNWVEATQKSHPGKAWPCYCIGPVTAQTAQELGLEVRGVAKVYTVDGLLQCLQGHLLNPLAG